MSSEQAPCESTGCETEQVTVTKEQRVQTDRRSESRERRAAPDRRKGMDRRRGPGRRRGEVRRAAEEGEITGELLEFIMALDEYKRINERPFPSWSEVFEIIQYLGYRKVADPAKHINTASGSEVLESDKGCTAADNQ